MKIQTCTKILSAFLMFPSAHVLATVVNINSDQTDYTFASGTTYFVETNVTLHGTTTFESGTILKYTNSGLINIPSDGTVVCPGGAEPAIFTSMNDDSVGETISGSSGVPSANDWWAYPATYDVNTFLKVTNVTLSNMRFSYAYIPLESPSETPYMVEAISVQNCQFFYDCDQEMHTERVFNNLFVETYVDWSPSGDVYDPEADGGGPDYDNDNLMVNNTFVNSGMELDNLDGDQNQGEVWVFNNLFDTTDTADFTYHGAIGGDNAFYDAYDGMGSDYSGLPGDWALDSEPDYQTGTYGSYYLPSDSPLIDAGGGWIIGDFGWPLLGEFTTQTDEAPDTSTVDIGYHYY